MKKIIFTIFSIALFASLEMNACSSTFGVDNSPPVCPEQVYDANTALDWTTQTFTYYKDVNGSPVATNISSPFYQSIGNTANVFSFSLPIQKDFAFQDGWRFVKQQFGKPTEGVSNPWFMLYNVHSGILRLFFAIDEAQQNDYAQISISWFGNQKTALLDHYSPIQAVTVLDNFQGGTASNPNQFSNTVAPAFWLHADFAMYYDPCTCTLDSDLQLTVDLVDQANLQLSFAGELNQIDLQANAAGMIPGGDVSKSAGLNDFVSGFKSVQSGASTLSKIFTKASPGSPATPAISDGDGNLIVPAKPAIAGIPAGTISTFIDVVSLFTGGGAIIQGAAKVFGLLFGSSPSPAAPAPAPKPLKFDIKMEASGTITNNSTYQDIQMQTPGGDHTGNDPEFIPHYDNIMGIMSIIEAKARIEWGVNFSYGIIPVSAVRFSLDEQIEFAINPRAEINLSHQNLTQNYIKAAWEFTTSDGTVNTSDYYDLNCFVNYKPYFDFVSVAQTNGSNPPGNLQNWFTLDALGSVRIKILALFTTNDGIQIPYIVTVFPNWVDLNGTMLSDELGTEFPTNICNNPAAPLVITDPNYPEPAKNPRIATVCNSTKYKTRSGQQLVGEDGEIMVRKDNSDGSNGTGRILDYNELATYPNPASQYFTLRYGIETGGPIKVTLHNTNGEILKVILEEDFHGKGIYEIGVDVSDLIPGSYYIKNQKDSGIDSKVIILH